MVRIRFLLLGALCFLLSSVALHAQQFTVTNQQLVSSVRVSLYQYDYTYQVTATNSGAGVANANCVVTSTTPNTIVESGNLSFGNMASGGSAISTTTLVLRQDRRYAFNWSNLQWQWSSTPILLDPNSIMGFETLGTWGVVVVAPPPGFMVTSTTNRTQGSAAYSITNPPNMVKLISEPIASTATALTGMGNAGALLQIDVLLPVQPGGTANSGSVQSFVTSPSRGLSNVSLGEVNLNTYRSGIYNTIGFSIPAEVSSALGGATFNDLTFEFDVSTPDGGTYLFDNLRVHSVPLVDSPTGTPPPPGYGGSVNLDVFGNAPVTQSFNVGPTQIPNGFHLKMGSAGITTVQLQLGLDGNPTLTCTYDPDGTDTTDRTYTLQSCNNGFVAGDLVNSNWVSLAIVGGDSTQEIRAQIAMNPMGDLTGAGLLPPMPTFWGDADTCAPAPVPGTVVTTSPSCSNQVAEANQIITNYFNQVNNANPSPNWIVAPVPEFAVRRGDGTPTNNLNGPPPTPLDPPFNTGAHLNAGGSWDAYWTLQGDLTPTAVAGTDENDTHFNATFNASVVLFGTNIGVVDATVTTDTDSAQTTPNQKDATSSGEVNLFLLGSQVPGSTTVTPSAGFNVDIVSNHEFDVPVVKFWIFSLAVGATANVGLTATGARLSSGLNVSVTPSATLGVNAVGTVDVVLASGSVKGTVNLLTINTPVDAQAEWAINPSPLCSITVDGGVAGDVNYSSGGGKLDLNGTVGICPFCFTFSYTPLQWPPLDTTSLNLFNDQINSQFRLPPGLAACGTWQGTYSGQTIKCTASDSNGCCIARGGTKVLSGPASATFTQNGTSVTADVEGEVLTGTNINGDLNLQTTVLGFCHSIEVPAGLVGTFSPDSSTLSGSFYINRNRAVTGTFSVQSTTPQP